MVDYRFQRRFRAANGSPGQGRNCTGRSGDDLTLKVPVGTTVIDIDTNEVLGDLSEAGQCLKVAQGGFHGLGILALSRVSTGHLDKPAPVQRERSDA